MGKIHLGCQGGLHGHGVAVIEQVSGSDQGNNVALLGGVEQFSGDDQGNNVALLGGVEQVCGGDEDNNVALLGSVGLLPGCYCRETSF